MHNTNDVTALLQDWRQGNEEALNRLVALVYKELRRLASANLKGQWYNYSLQPTALVNEAFIKLTDCNKIDWKNRAHFFGVASKLMRNILVDKARRKLATKREGERFKVSLQDIHQLSDPVIDRDLDLIALDDALQVLEKLDIQQSRIVELRYFGGLNIEETAEALGVSASTITREWRLARAWLLHRLDKRTS